MGWEGSPGNLSQVSRKIAAYLGLNFPPERETDLLRGLHRAAADLQFPDLQKFLHHLLTQPLQPREIHTLATHLTIGETYFMRDPGTMLVLREIILPRLLQEREAQQRRTLRIWSAGCASGEEPYSIAILVKKLVPDIPAWNIFILGTDVNPAALEKAQRGQYTRWSFRQTPPWVIQHYFRESEGGLMEILPEIRRMVTFRLLNLVTDTYPDVRSGTAGLDIILCRNVLMYFTEEARRKILHRFYHCLIEGGWLIVSPGEAHLLWETPFQARRYPEAILYQKPAEREATGLLAVNSRASGEITPSVPPAGIKSPSGASSGKPSGTPVLPRSPGRNGKTSPASPLRNRRHPTIEDAYQKALRHYQRGEYREVIGLLENALNAGDAPRGEAFCEGKVFHLLARTHANMGDLPSAQAWCQKAIQAESLNGEHYYLLGLIHQEREDFPAAMGALRRALFLQPDLIMARVALARIHLHQGRHAAAEREIRQAMHRLEDIPADQEVPASDGLTAGELKCFLEALSAPVNHTR